MQVSDRAMVQEKVRDGNALVLVPFRAVAQIEQNLLGSGLFQRLHFGCDLLRLALCQSFGLHVANPGLVHHFVRDRRNADRVARDRHLLRLGLARSYHLHIESRTRSSAQQIPDFRQRHIARALPFNCFKDVGRLDSRLLSRRSRQHRHHCRIPEALRNHRADPCLAFRLVILE